MAKFAYFKYRLPAASRYDKGHFSWFNQINGSFQAEAEDFGLVELAWFYPDNATKGLSIKRGHPVGLDCGGATSPLIGASNWDNDNAIPFVDYCTASERSKFLGLVIDTMPPVGRQDIQNNPGSAGRFEKTLIRVALQGIFLPFNHGFLHMTKAYLPTQRGLPLTNVDTGGQHVGYFLKGDADGYIADSGIYLNP